MTEREAVEATDTVAAGIATGTEVTAVTVAKRAMAGLVAAWATAEARQESVQRVAKGVVAYEGWRVRETEEVTTAMAAMAVEAATARAEETRAMGAKVAARARAAAKVPEKAMGKQAAVVAVTTAASAAHSDTHASDCTRA